MDAASTFATPSLAEQQQQQKQHHNILYIAWLIQQKLVADLVASVIEHAGLYYRQTSASNEYRVTKPSNSPATCLVSDSIVNHARSLLPPVRSLTFHLVTKDQGYAAWPAGASLTWFTAAILRDSEIIQERELFRNSMSGTGFTAHERVWTADAASESEAAWVQTLRAGDCVVIRAYAERHGWINFVNGVQVTLSTAIIVR